MTSQEEILKLMTRRHFFGRAARGLGTVALASLLNRNIFAAAAQKSVSRHVIDPLHFVPRAKRIIYLFQSGAPSQLDLFDYKAKLIELNGQGMPESYTKGQRIAQLAG